MEVDMKKNRRVKFTFFLDPDNPTEAELLGILSTKTRKATHIKNALIYYFKVLERMSASYAPEGSADESKRAEAAATQLDSIDLNNAFADAFKPFD
jgi:hypothetical protein